MCKNKINQAGRFVITKAGRVKHPNWDAVSCCQAGAQSLYDLVAAEFGRAVARKLLNMICIGDKELGPIYEIGTISRIALLNDLIETVGRYVPGQGFMAYADEAFRLGFAAE